MSAATGPGRATLAAAIAAAILLLGALPGCGGDDSSGEESQETTALTPAETTDDGEGAGGDGEGAGDDGEGAGDEQQVEAAIEALLTDPDNEFVCSEVLSEELLGTAYGDLDGCLEGRARPTLADSVKEISGLRVEGNAASAEAVPRGGLYSDVTLEVEAVRSDDGWRIDRFVADLPVGP